MVVCNSSIPQCYADCELDTSVDKSVYVVTNEQFYLSYNLLKLGPAMINDALRLVREFHNINQSQLAKKLGISRSYLSEIESGKKTPNFELLDKYANIFDIPPSSLLLFSENLENENFSERTKSFIAKKIIKIMDWLSDSENMRDSDYQKSA